MSTTPPPEEPSQSSGGPPMGGPDEPTGGPADGPPGEAPSGPSGGPPSGPEAPGEPPRGPTGGPAGPGAGSPGGPTGAPPGEPTPGSAGWPAAGPAGGPPADDRNWAVAAHLSALIAFVGIPSFVGPLVVWLVRRDRPFAAEHSREALNFNLSVLIYVVVGGVALAIVTVLTLGLGAILLIPAAIAVFIAWLVFVIQAAMKASRGEPYRYPLTLRLIT